MNHTVPSFLRLLALCWLALGMVAPVSAWSMHEAEHGAIQVSVDEHHYHKADGGISIQEHAADENGGDAPDGGHDHMPSILLGAVTVPQAGVSLTEPVVVRQIFAIPASRGVVRYASDGLRRPPKLG